MGARARELATRAWSSDHRVEPLRRLAAGDLAQLSAG
jgi:hypothetical protein